MTGPGAAGSPVGDGPALSEFAQQWASALAWTSYVPMSREERHTTLVGFAARLAAALTAQPFTEQPGYDVGAALVFADFAAPEALGATIQIIDERLLTAIGLDRTDEFNGRLAELLGALATGYSWALRDRTLDE